MGKCCKIGRRIGKDNVSLFKCESNSKQFSSDEKELNFCTMTASFSSVSYYWSYS